MRFLSCRLSLTPPPAAGAAPGQMIFPPHMGMMPPPSMMMQGGPPGMMMMQGAPPGMMLNPHQMNPGAVPPTLQGINAQSQFRTVGRISLTSHTLTAPVVSVSSGPQSGQIHVPGKPVLAPPPGWTPTLAITKAIFHVAATPITVRASTRSIHCLSTIQESPACSSSSVPQVFIGKIPGDVANDLLLACLKECGRIKNWNRPHDVYLHPKGFGFVTFENGTLPCDFYPFL